MKRPERPTANSQSSLELLTAILDATDSLIVVLDPEGRIVEFNRACEAATGFDSDQVRGRCVWETLIPEDEVEDVKEAFGRLQATEFPNRHENHWMTMDGGRRMISWSNIAVVDDAGEVRYVVGTGIDVTDLTVAEARLEASETQYKTLVENMTDGLVVDDVDGNITFVNTAFCEMVGFSQGELLGRTFADILTPERRKVLAEQNAIRHTESDPASYELTFLRNDGSTLDVLVSPQRLLSTHGEPMGSFGVMTDITRIKRMEENQSLLGTAIEQSAEAVVITDADGTIRYVNPAFELISGYSSEEAIGANPRVLKSGKHDDAFYRDLWETISGGRVWSGFFTNLRKDGSLYEEEATISPVLDEDGEIVAYVAVKRDVSVERQLSLQLNRARKLEALGELAGGIAHDFNNLFMAIIGSAELLRLRLPAASEARGELKTIHEAVSRGADLTRRLLSVAQQQMLEMVVIDLNKTVRRELEILQRVLPDSIKVEFKPEPGPLAIRCDRSHLEQILLNLCSNAREAMRDGGVITVSTAEITADSLLLAAHPEAKEGSYARLRVEDTGVGMDADVRDRAFDAFYSTKSETRKSGLGLATVYGIVRQHNGMVEVDSTPGTGSRFDLFFPLTSEAVEQTDSGPKRAAIGGSETILVVEDEERVRQTQVGMLKALGYAVLQAENGRVALDILMREGDAIDMVLSDVTMPEMGGRELLDRARELRPNLTFVFSSGYTGGEFLDGLHRGETVHFIGKPHTMAQLAEIIREALAG